MPRQDGRIEQGQSLRSAISARAWNRAQDAADIVLGQRYGTMAGPIRDGETATVVIPIRNQSGAAVPWLGVLGISGPLISPVNGSLTGSDPDSRNARQFVSQPAVNGRIPQVGDAVVVCMEPIADGAIGRAAVGGVFACRVLMLQGGHTYAAGKAGDISQLQSANCGPIRLLWKSGSSGQIWAYGTV
jgi:hypothetical protein